MSPVPAPRAVAQLEGLLAAVPDLARSGRPEAVREAFLQLDRLLPALGPGFGRAPAEAAWLRQFRSRLEQLGRTLAGEQRTVAAAIAGLQREARQRRYGAGPALPAALDRRG